MLKLLPFLILAFIMLLGGCNSHGAEITQIKTVTAYCGCAKCCGKWSQHHLTADGHIPQQGITIAASRSIPFGTKIKIKNHIYTVQDRLAPKYDDRIDVYFDNHKDALKFGKQKLSVEILK